MPDEDVEFFIEVSNTGPGTAKAVTLTDPLPSGTAGAWFIESQPAANPCTITGNTLSCSFGDMVQGASVSIEVEATTDRDNCSVYDNTAIASAINSPDAADDASVACETTNLSINKSGNGTINAGQNVKFTMTVTNDGPGTAKGVTLSDPLPSGTAGAWAIASQPAGDPCSIGGKTLSCSFGDLAPGASVTVKVKAPTSKDKCAVYENTATAAATNSPKVEDDATVRCKKPAPPKPVIKLKKTSNRKKVQPGQTVRYQVWIRNTKKGSVAKNLKICDRLPRRMSIVRNGRGFFDNGRLCWKLDELPYQKKWTTHFHYSAKVDGDVKAGTKLKNVVTVGKKKASRTVVVIRPQGVAPAGGGGNTPVTG